MNEQTGKLLDLLEGVVTSNTKMEIDGRITISRQNYSKLPKRLAKACKDASLAFVEVVTPPSLQDPGADTYPIVREIEVE